MKANKTNAKAILSKHHNLEVSNVRTSARRYSDGSKLVHYFAHCAVPVSMKALIHPDGAIGYAVPSAWM